MNLRMAVNGMDTLMYGARLLSRSIGVPAVTTYDDWLKGAMNPIVFGQQTTYRQIKLNFLVKDGDDKSAFTNMSGLLARMRQCSIKFQDMDYAYDCVLQEAGEPEKSIMDGRFKLEVTLKAAYAYTSEEEQSYDLEFTTLDNSIDVNVKGNLPVPIIVQAELLEADTDLNLMFNVDPDDDTSIKGWIKNGFIMRPLYKNSGLIVDGEKCTVFQNGQNDYNSFWGNFVTLQPGNNTVPVSFEALNNGDAELSLKIKYKPRYM